MSGRRDTPDSANVEPLRGFDDYEVSLGDVMRGERATKGKSLLDVQRELQDQSRLYRRHRDIPIHRPSNLPAKPTSLAMCGPMLGISGLDPGCGVRAPSVKKSASSIAERFHVTKGEAKPNHGWRCWRRNPLHRRCAGRRPLQAANPSPECAGRRELQSPASSPGCSRLRCRAGRARSAALAYGAWIVPDQRSAEGSSFAPVPEQTRRASCRTLDPVA